MAQPELLPLLVRPLDEAGITYMVTGALAASIYGEPRFTNDVDLVISLDAAHAAALESIFPAPDFYCPDAETIRAESARPTGGHFNIIHGATALRADCYPIGDVPLYRWGLEHRRRVHVDGLDVWIAPPEYVILMKLEFLRLGGRAKHIDDIDSMLETLGDAVDRSVITDWSTRLGCDAQWRDAQARVP